MDKTKCFAQFAGSARLTIKYSGPGWTILDNELVALLAQYGLTCTDRGYDLISRERELVFHPAQLTPLELHRQYLGKFPGEHDSLTGGTQASSHSRRAKMKNARALFSGLADEVLWVIYNLAFLAFGKTRLWPNLGYAIWR